MRAILIVCAVAASAVAEPASTKDDDLAFETAGHLADAVKGGDAVAVEAHLQAPLRYKGFAFDDDACAKAFGDHGTVVAKKLHAFAACLAGQPTIVTKAMMIGGLDDPKAAEPPSDDVDHLYIYAARTGRKQVVRIDRIAGPPDDGEVENGIEGGVAGGVVDEAPPPPPPPPPSPAVIVAPQVIRAARIAGTDDVPPDDKTKAAIAKDGKDRVIAVSKICFGVDGKVSRVTVIKASGYPAWDTALTAAQRAWAIKPYVVNGAPREVCTAITWIYRRR